MKTLYLVGCSKQKREGWNRAEDLYISPLFQKSRQWVLSQMQPEDSWLILSGYHGMVFPSTRIHSYNYSLQEKNYKVRAQWASHVWSSGLCGLLNCGFLRVVFLAGDAYVQFLRAAISSQPSILIEEPLKGLEIGERLRWLNDYEKARGA